MPLHIGRTYFPYRMNMSALLSTLFSLLSGIPGLLGDYFKKRQELESKKLEAQIALQTEQIKLSAQLALADEERAKASLSSTGMWFKYCTFWLISSPFIACLLGQTWYATMVFDNLRALPDWYMILYSGIIGVIWGIPVPGSIMGTIWQGIKDGRQASRDYKLAKLDRKKYFDAMRTIFPKGMSQSQVETINKALDSAEQ